jgi:hypothetical protein
MKDRSGLPDRVLAAIEILSLGSWVGALAGFAFVTAPLAYSLVAPISVSRFAALTIGSLATLTLWGYVFGGLALGVAVVRSLDAESRRWDLVRAAIIAVALALATYEQQDIVPQMKATPIASAHYRALHQRSTRFYGGAMLAAAVALALAAGRRDPGRPFDEPHKKPPSGKRLPLKFETRDRRA